MNRKIMSWLSYGFYFIVICLILVGAYLLFFKDNRPKHNNTNNNEENNNPGQVQNESIKLNSQRVSLDIGGSFSLRVTLVPSSGNEIINFTSSDENIVKVDSTGKLIGVGSGEAIVTVTVSGTDLKTECNVKVSNTTITVNNLFVANETIKIKAGETYQLNVTATPVNAVDKSVTFKSDNERVATVDENGLVTTLTKGNADIIITSNANPEVVLKVLFLVG